MKAPARLQPLIDEGLIDRVVRRLKSGKKADVYAVPGAVDPSGVLREIEDARVDEAARLQRAG